MTAHSKKVVQVIRVEPKKDRFMTPREAAEYLNCSTSLLRYNVRNKQLARHVFSAAVVRYRKSDLDEFIAKSRQKAIA